MYSQEQINQIVAEAKGEAFRASDQFFKDKLGGRDQFSCGFAWVDIFGIKGKKLACARAIPAVYRSGTQQVMVAKTSTPLKPVPKQPPKCLRNMVSVPMLARG